MSSVASEQPSSSLPFLPWAGQLLGYRPGSAQSWKGNHCALAAYHHSLYQGGWSPPLSLTAGWFGQGSLVKVKGGRGLGLLGSGQWLGAWWTLH